MTFDEVVDAIGKGVDVAGIAIIVIGVIVGTVGYLSHVRADAGSAYRDYRVGLGRAILLGLEFLIAGDIIRTVATSPTFRGVGILGTIVLIRTFLSITLNLEVEGRLPWKRGKGSTASS
ncbi:MAG: DUF1622 domain-containing protein [bacterium]